MRSAVRKAALFGALILVASTSFAQARLSPESRFANNVKLAGIEPQ